MKVSELRAALQRWPDDAEVELAITYYAKDGWRGAATYLRHTPPREVRLSPFRAGTIEITTDEQEF